MARPKPSISSTDLAAAQDRFVQAWGQMGPAWGISRTMAEVHALLYIAGQPMNSDEVMERLEISRGNASISLRSLVEWGIVSRVHKRGERKEYFEAEQDVWAMARVIMRERLRREIMPLLASLYEIRDQTGPGASPSTAADPLEPALVEAHNRRLDKLLDLVRTSDTLAERFVGSGGRGLQMAASVLSKIA